MKGTFTPQVGVNVPFIHIQQDRVRGTLRRVPYAVADQAMASQAGRQAAAARCDAREDATQMPAPLRRIVAR
jgi:hypothetical protein